MNNSYKYLLKNIGLLVISQFATKILVFFLVPLYTTVLSTAEYGTYDLFSTTVSLLIPILTLNVAESTLIYTMDKEHDNKAVISVGLKYSVIGFCLSFIIVLVNKVLNIFPAFNKYWVFLPVMMLLTSVNTTFSYFARGIDKVRHTAIAGILSSIVLIVCNILFLLIFKIGLLGYFISHILAILVQIIYLMISCRLTKYIVFNPTPKTERDMRKFSYPLIANTIGWWINNSSDRYIVTLMCGVAANGIYSVGYKIPSILNMFQTIFNQAWTISAVKDFDPDDRKQFFSNIYNLYNCGMVIVCSIVILSSRLLARFLYAKDFFTAWRYVPWLTIAIVFGALSGFLGGVFSAVKDSKRFGESTVIGAVVNIVLNIILVHYMDAVGAAVATTISFLVVWIIRLGHVRTYIKINIKISRDCVSYVLLCVQGILLFIMTDGIVLYCIETGIFMLIVCSYKKEIRGILCRNRKSQL